MLSYDKELTAVWCGECLENNRGGLSTSVFCNSVLISESSRVFICISKNLPLVAF